MKSLLASLIFLACVLSGLSQSQSIVQLNVYAGTQRNEIAATSGVTNFWPDNSNSIWNSIAVMFTQNIISVTNSTILNVVAASSNVTVGITTRTAYVSVNGISNVVASGDIISGTTGGVTYLTGTGLTGAVFSGNASGAVTGSVLYVAGMGLTGAVFSGSASGTVTGSVLYVNGSTNPPVALTTNVFYVDADRGNDSTAVRGRYDLPWRTVEAAGHTANGNTRNIVWVRPGVYTLTNSAFPSSTTAPPAFHLEPGVLIQLTSSAAWAGFPAQAGTTTKTVITGNGVLSDYGRTNASARILSIAGAGVDVTCDAMFLAGHSSINNSITYGPSIIRCRQFFSSNNSGDVNVILVNLSSTVTSDIDIISDTIGTHLGWSSGGVIWSDTPRVSWFSAGSGYQGRARWRTRFINTGYGIGSLSDGGHFHADIAYIGGHSNFSGSALSSIIGIPGGAFNYVGWTFGSYYQRYGGVGDFRPYVNNQMIHFKADNFVSFSSNGLFTVFLEHSGNGTYTGATNAVLVEADNFLATAAPHVFSAASEFATSTLYTRFTRGLFPRVFLRRAEDASPFNIRVTVLDSDLVQSSWTNGEAVFRLDLASSSYSNTNGPAGYWRNNQLELVNSRVRSFGTNSHITCLSSNNNVILRNSFLLGTNPVSMSTGGFESNNVFSYGGWLQGTTQAGWNVNGVLNIEPTLR